MADGWADFKSSAGGGTAPGATDDDWADFGGFESASPAANPFGDSSVSTAFPWAAAFPTNVEKPAQTGTPPVFPAEASGLPVSSSQRLLTGSTSAVFQPTSLPSVQNSAAVKTPTQANTASQPPVVSSNDIITSSTEITTESSPKAFQTEQLYQNIGQGGVVLGPTLGGAVPGRPKGTTSSPTAQVNDPSELREAQDKLKQADEKVSHYETLVEDSGRKLSLAEREKLRLEKSLNEMKTKYSEAHNLATEQYLEIEKQKEKYEQLQEKHEEQLKALRDAGKESFALIVEEYKELSRTAVSQQQEASEKHLQRVLDEEREKFTVFINQQNENMKLLVKEEQEKNVKRLEEALQQQKANHQADLNECLEEERRKCKEAVEKAVEEERARAKILIAESISEQKKEFDAFIEEQKKMFEENLLDERKETTKQIEKALKDEQERAKDAIEEALAEERQKSRDAVEAVKEKTKEEMQKYLEEKGKDDGAVRLRNYQAMDLFLQGVQTQLKSLMNNSDIPPSSSS